MDTVEGMRTFVAVAMELSFTGAAKRLGISAKVASKQIQQLESKLAAQLFYRTTRSVTLTETGRAYFDRCVPLLDQFDELENLVQSNQTVLAGPIRIAAPTAFGSSLLIAALKGFQLEHPKVRVDLSLSDTNVALVEEGFDLGIRFGQLQDSSLIAHRFLDMRVVICASPNYLEQHGEPSHPKDLSTHNCLVQSATHDGEHWTFKVDDQLISVPVSGSFSTNSPRALAHMAAGGLGITQVPKYVLEPFLASGELQLLFENNEASDFSLYAIYPPSRHLTARIRALIDYLAEYFEHY